MISIKKYQEFCRLDSGLTMIELNVEYAKLMGLDLNSDQETINKHRTQFFNNLVANNKQHSHVKLKGKWYKVDRDLYKLTLLQWADFDNTMKLVQDKKIYDVMDRIITIFLRPCRFYKWFPKKYKQDEHLIKIVQTELDIKIALEMTNFFFSIYDDFYSIFGNKLFRRIGKGSVANKRLDELYNDYGWYLTIKNLSKDVFDFERVVNLEFGTIISWLELSKATQEIDHIQQEQMKKQLK